MISAYDKHNYTTPARTLNLTDVHGIIKSGTYKTTGDLAAITTALRSINPALKATLPIATFSAKFTANRATTAPHVLSGYVCVDFDKLAPEQLKTLYNKLLVSDYTNLLFISPSGNGIKWVVAIDGLTNSNFSEVARALLHHTDSTLGATTDKSCVDLARACYLCHDPSAFLNDVPANYTAADLLAYYAPFKPVTAAPAAATLATSGTGELGKVKALLKHCQDSGTSLTADYSEWLTVGSALAKEFDDNTARELFHEFSKLDTSYEMNNVDAKFNEIVKSIKPNNKIGLGSFYHIVKAKGLPIPKVTKQGQRAMITQAITDRYAFYLDTDTHNVYRSSANNNDPTQYQKIDAQCAALNAMLSELETLEINTNKQTLWECIYNEYTYKEISLLQDTLTHMGLQWDGNDHFKTLMDCIDVYDKELFVKQFSKWCITLIAQAYGKGRNDYAMILVGAQGTGKTTFFDQLLFDGKYSANTTAFDPANKNEVILLNTKLLIILDEMATYSKSDLNQLKSTLTKGDFSADRKFQNERDYKRNASFCGTSNNAELLRDATGDRRYLVFELTKAIDFALYNSIDKKQLWAQIITMFHNGVDFKFNQAEINEIIQRNADNYTMQTQEDYFIAEIIDFTNDENDKLFNSTLNEQINEYMKCNGGLTSRINSDVVRQKLKQKGLVYKTKYNAHKKESEKGFIGAKLKQKSFF